MDSTRLEYKMKIDISPYDQIDEEAVAALWREAFPESPNWNHPETDIRRKLAIQRELFLVATYNDNVVGTAMAGYDGHRGWVYYLAVSSKYRRRGLGKALMTSVEQRLTLMGCPKLNLQVRIGNEGVVAFYENLGYQVEPRISMSKPLA
jgi:ribosomal protein S18 acetylase RimI-like enzyme